MPLALASNVNEPPANTAGLIATVVITGAGSGIGRATAIAFAREGANVAGCDLDRASLETLAREMEALGVEFLPCVASVADETAMKSFAASRALAGASATTADAALA